MTISPTNAAVSVL